MKVLHQAGHEFPCAIEIDRKGINTDLVELEAAARLEPQADPRARALWWPDAKRRDIATRAEIGCRVDLDRPKRDVLPGPKLAGSLLTASNPGAQGCSAREQNAVAQIAFSHVRFESGYAHRGHRRQEMRVHHFEHVLTEPLVFLVELQLQARCQESKAFQQSFYVGIGTFESFQPNATGDLRVFLRELRAHITQMLELGIIE